MIVLLYQSVTRANITEGLQWLKEMQEMHGNSGYMANIKSTLLEQKLLLKLLAINGKLLSQTYKPKQASTEQKFKVSFLLPLGPLGYEDIAKLNNDAGCVLCGKKTISRCSRCQSVAYCGSGAVRRNHFLCGIHRALFVDCQKADWPAHKPVCRSLHGGTWRTARFVTVVPGTEGLYTAKWNKFSSPADIVAAAPEALDPSTVPPNTHGSRPFLVKLQAPLATGFASIMVYDRQRSFQGYFMLDDNTEVYPEMLKEMQGPRGGHGGVKMYRWVKRSSDWELSVCMDKEPQTDIKW